MARTGTSSTSPCPSATAWSTVDVPIPTGYTNSGLAGIACTGATGCWAVGKADLTSRRVPLMMRWDGRAWFTVAIATPSGATSGDLSGVTCPLSGRCRAVGGAAVANLQRTFVTRFTP